MSHPESSIIQEIYFYNAHPKKACHNLCKRNLFHRHNKYHHSTTSRQPGNPGTVATQAGAIVSSHTGFSHCTRSHYCHLDFHIQWFLTWIIHIEINITRHHPALWKASLTQPELRNVKLFKQDFTPKKVHKSRQLIYAHFRRPLPRRFVL